MKTFKILATVIAMTLSASAFADGGYVTVGNYVGNVSPRGNVDYNRGGHNGGHNGGHYRRDGGRDALIILGSMAAGAILANEVRQEPQVVYQQPQVVYQQPVYQQPQVVYVPSNIRCNGNAIINGVYYCPVSR